MGYPDNCAHCGESYDNDNLMACRRCRAEVCYRCGSGGLCERCRKSDDAAAAPSPSPTAAHRAAGYPWQGGGGPMLSGNGAT